MSEIDTKPIIDAILAVEEEMKTPLPTPPIGKVVIWYDRARVDPNNQRAAVVTRAEGPGKLTLTIFPPNSMAIHKQGSLHVSHRIHEQRASAVSKNSGAWDYVDGDGPEDDHFQIHRDQLSSKKEMLQMQLAQAEEANGAQETPKKPIPKRTTKKATEPAQT